MCMKCLGGSEKKSRKKDAGNNQLKINTFLVLSG